MNATTAYCKLCEIELNMMTLCACEKLKLSQEPYIPTQLPDEEIKEIGFNLGKNAKCNLSESQLALFDEILISIEGHIKNAKDIFWASALSGQYENESAFELRLGVI